MKKITNFKILIVVIIIVAMACSKSGDNIYFDTTWKLDRPKSGDVYVAGIVSLGSAGLEPAVAIWKNGLVQYLTDGTFHVDISGGVNSIFVSGNDVYVAGTIVKIKHGRWIRTATLWKNGIAQHFYDETNPNETYANSVFVVGNDVYVAGHEGRFARLWKNGVVQNLDLANSDGSWANSVFVYNGDVYVAGTKNIPGSGRHVATLWKNGVVQYLSYEENGFGANSVFVSDNDVYVAGRGDYATAGGWRFRTATIWKNGVAQNLNDGTNLHDADASSVFVSGNDVYVVGSRRNNDTWQQFARLWKNGIVQNLNLTNGESSVAHSVFVFDNDVYVAGTETRQEQDLRYEVATLWKNGVVEILPHGFEQGWQSRSITTRGTSVFVVK